MSKRDRTGDLEEIFEILVTSYAQKGGVIPGESDLCWRPATDAYETEDAFVVQMDLAGMDPAQIEVLADEKSLARAGNPTGIVGPGQEAFPQDGDQRRSVRPPGPHRGGGRSRHARRRATGADFCTSPSARAPARPAHRRQIAIDSLSGAGGQRGRRTLDAPQVIFWKELDHMADNARDLMDLEHCGEIHAAARAAHPAHQRSGHLSGHDGAAGAERREPDQAGRRLPGRRQDPRCLRPARRSSRRGRGRRDDRELIYRVGHRGQDPEDAALPRRQHAPAGAGHRALPHRGVPAPTSPTCWPRSS